MGVYKLWELLLTIAQPMDLQQLSGKVLAIDASIWIVKIDSLYNSNAQKLKSILSKIMLLKRNNILPLFVFDGVAPVLKRKTLEERYQRRLVAGEQEARKISELEVMRMVEGTESNTRLSEKSKRIQKNEQDLNELNKTLSILSQFQEKAEKQISNEVLEKIAMQSEILNTKYHIMLDITPNLANYRFFLTPQEYEGLDLEKKMEYLEQLQEYKWKLVKASRRNNQALTQQEKLIRDLQVIQKRSKVRQMQDALFRKMMQKNVVIENGYEVVQTIYNGRKVIQKRKVKEAGNGFGIGLKKGKMKNSINSLNFQQENLDQDERPDDFLAQFCSHTVSFKSNHSSNDSQSQSNTAVSQRQNNAGKQKRQREGKRKQEESEQEGVYLPFQNYKLSQKEDQPQNYVNKRQLKEKNRESGETEDFQDKDRLPTYIPNESFLNLNYSNDNLELQNLLKVLGIPYLIAPSQAEAQCAALEQLGVVDGVVTEDSDTFLFGAKRVFRGVFQGNVRLYDYRNIQQRLRLNRQKLIIFALLLGSDYTPGVKGIGIVNAMEIIKVFATFQRLEAFKEWARLPDVLLPEDKTTEKLLEKANPLEIEFYELHRRFKNHWYVDQQFGNKRVQEAYMKPEVIDSEKILSMQKQGLFKLGACNGELLEKLLKQKLNLEPKQFDHFMKVLTFEFKVKREKTLDHYFTKLNQSNQMAKIRSKRLEKSLMQPDKDKEEL